MISGLWIWQVWKFCKQANHMKIHNMFSQKEVIQILKEILEETVKSKR